MVLIRSVYFWVLLLSSAVSGGSALYLFRLKKVPGALSLSLLMISLWEYALMYAVELMVPDLETKVMIAKIEYIGIVFFPIGWLAFTSSYMNADNPRPLPAPLLAGLSLPLMTTLVLAWTNEMHNALWRNPAIIVIKGLRVLTWEHGFWFWIHIVYAYTLILFGIIFLLQRLRRNRTDYRGQTVLITAGLLAPIIFNVMYLAGYSLGPVLDPTPLGFTISGLAFLLSIRLYSFFKIIPVAQRTIVNNLDSGIFIINNNGEIIDTNTAAMAMTSRKYESTVGLKASSYFSSVHENLGALSALEEGEDEFEISRNGSALYYYARIKSLYNTRNMNIGRILIIHDMTTRKNNEQKLLEARQKDFLMKELNHRVKNNLLMISSLIRLRKSSGGNTADLSELENQIAAIRLVHERLSNTENNLKIDMKHYIQDLLSSIFSMSTSEIIIDNSIDNVFLETQVSIPLGLIINEMATNAVKYGFIDDEEARFTVYLKEDSGEKQYLLRVSNTGNPFPDHIDLASPGTLGLRIISALTQQLDGTIELQRRPSTVFSVRFSI